MTLNKNKTVQKIGQRTRLKNRDVQLMLETLVEVWTKELSQDGRIEIENFLVLEVKWIDRGENAGMLLVGGKLRRAPQLIPRLFVRPSKQLRKRLRIEKSIMDS